jgi:uncharacterized DUF497 family protein
MGPWGSNLIGMNTTSPYRCHDVTPEEVEDAFAAGVLVMNIHADRGEELVVCAGKTGKGRVLQIVYTVRSKRIRVITAHEARKLRKLL